MVRRLLNRIAAPVRGLHEAAYVLAGLTLVSQLLALVRDRTFAHAFGAGPTLDTYYAAFRVPDFLFATIASLLSLYALTPVLSRLEAEHPGRMITFLRQMLLAFFVGMAIVSGIAFVFAPELMRLVAPGFSTDPVATGHLILLTRILLLQPILLGASNMLANLTQLRHRFTLYAISPLLYNIGIIIGVLVFYPILGVAGLAWGVVFGAAMHVAVQIPYFVSEKAEGRIPFKESLRHLREVLALSIPRTFALASTQISLLALTALASYLAAGSISVFMFAYNLQAVPVAIIGVSYSVAAFPTLARLFAEGKNERLTEHVETALRHLLFWSIPAMVLTIVLRADLVRVILGSGAFDWAATRLTAAALALFVISLVGQNLSLLIARTYYAAGNSRKPLYYGLVDITVSIGSALFLVSLFHSSDSVRLFIEALLRVDAVPGGTTVLMLALAYALGSTLEAVVAYFFFARDFGIPQQRIRRLALQSFGASVIGGAAAYGGLVICGYVFSINTTIGLFCTCLISGVIGVVVIALMLALMKNEELPEVLGALRMKLSSVTKVAVEPTDIES